ncbi:MAG TPA: hypothetical protein VKU42_00090 [Candidatus Angelobacter sp.]|nr:hypothetical protein [Candidatus Angelobacter sp.]
MKEIDELNAAIDLHEQNTQASRENITQKLVLDKNLAMSAQRVADAQTAVQKKVDELTAASTQPISEPAKE